MKVQVTGFSIPCGQPRQVWKYIEKYKYTRNMLLSIDENSRAAEPDDIKL